MNKKLLSIVLSVLICLSTVACSHQYVDVNTDPTSASEDTSNVAIDYYMPRFDDYESYSEYVNTHSFPADFINYTALSALGEFKTFICFPLNYTEYNYDLTDANGRSIFLTIEHKTFEITAAETGMTLLSEENMTDLWQHPSGTSGYILKNGCVFHYINGNLLCVMWGSGNISFTMSIDLPADKGTEYDKKDTLVDKLFDINTSPTAIAELQHIAYNK